MSMKVMSDHSLKSGEVAILMERTPPAKSEYVPPRDGSQPLK